MDFVFQAKHRTRNLIVEDINLMKYDEIYSKRNGLRNRIAIYWQRVRFSVAARISTTLSNSESVRIKISWIYVFTQPTYVIIISSNSIVLVWLQY